MHNENPIIHARVDYPSAGRVDCQSTDDMQPTNARLYNSDAQAEGMAQQRQRAKRTARWAGAVAVLVYVGFILSGVLGR
ncbi:MAG: hypothetical protein GAK31_03296 [Stenotrophomonas maltophilia]|uniref:Transmembrane protein n=1 Tax=Stenotrophomonas maltophilia TaxID=40324 RepID=A0A7V8FF75_STEMA|nr:MAG: hypothetical protein GAK31_03296 [Stenotrophomonas maltophilia]